MPEVGSLRNLSKSFLKLGVGKDKSRSCAGGGGGGRREGVFKVTKFVQSR